MVMLLMTMMRILLKTVSRSQAMDQKLWNVQDPPLSGPRSDNIRSFVAIFRRVNLDTHLPHLDLGRSLPGEAGEELDQAVGELQVVVVQRSEQTLSSITIIFGHKMCKEYKCL